MVAGNRDKQCQRSKPGFALLQRASARLSDVPYVCPPREFTVFDAVLALFDGSGCGFRHRGRDFDTEVEPHPKNIFEKIFFGEKSLYVEKIKGRTLNPKISKKLFFSKKSF